MITTEQLALELLATHPEGMTTGLVIVHGLALEVFDHLVERGLAIATEQRHPNGHAVTCYQITDAGWRMLENVR
jgi:DNA-binding PadR family transcriptional regulator